MTHTLLGLMSGTLNPKPSTLNLIGLDIGNFPGLHAGFEKNKNKKLNLIGLDIGNLPGLHAGFSTHVGD
jgi:hypothetical protein